MSGIYVHIPFCVKKCDYCDFVSFPGHEELFEKYIAALEREMSLYRGERADSVFIGGGTPTRLSGKLLERLAASISKNFNLTSDCEFTIEANPATVDYENAKTLFSCGVNRVSVGVQSFSDTELKAAGRIHCADAAEATVELFAKAGFKNISVDLMMSLPYQTEESFKASLERAVRLPVTHMSVYSLIIEDNTPIKKKYEDGIYKLPDEDTDRRLYAYTKEFLGKHGFERYEISNYAVRGYESRHNMKYWNFDKYIGIGLAAHSFDGFVRRENTESLEEYICGNFTASEEILTEKDRMGEFMFLSLRKSSGVLKRRFSELFGKTVESVYGDVLKKFVGLSLIEDSGEAYALTDRGLDIANTIMCEFV